MNVDTWWYGFKEAEQLFYEGYQPDYNDFLSDYIYLCKGGCMVGIPLKHSNRAKGVLEYIRYWNENKGSIKFVHSGIVNNEG